MLGEEALRLLREKWPNANELAEELYVILSSPDIPIETSAPITYTPPNKFATEPPLVINSNPDQPYIRMPSPTGGPGITITPFGIDLGGTPLYNQGYPPGNEPPPFPPVPGTFNGPPPVVSGGGGGGGIPGTIVSGTGANYVFQPTVGGPTINVVQGQIDPSETIPAGTFAIASLAGSTFYIAVPVWL